jgi:hypothetical protein
MEVWKTWRREKSWTVGKQTRGVQPVALRYTDWTISTSFSDLKELETNINNINIDKTAKKLIFLVQFIQLRNPYCIRRRSEALPFLWDAECTWTTGDCMSGILRPKFSFKFSEFERSADCDFTESKYINATERTEQDSRSTSISKEETTSDASLVTHISENIFHSKFGIHHTTLWEWKHFTSNIISEQRSQIADILQKQTLHDIFISVMW